MSQQISAEELAAYEVLVRPTTAGELGALGRSVETHCDTVEEASLTDELVELEVCCQIAQALEKLAGEAAAFSSEDRARVRGAIDYFLLTDDRDNDIHSPVGMEDDARVVNHMLGLIGRTELSVSFP